MRKFELKTKQKKKPDSHNYKRGKHRHIASLKTDSSACFCGNFQKSFKQLTWKLTGNNYTQTLDSLGLMNLKTPVLATPYGEILVLSRLEKFIPTSYSWVTLLWSFDSKLSCSVRFSHRWHVFFQHSDFALHTYTRHICLHAQINIDWHQLFCTRKTATCIKLLNR